MLNSINNYSSISTRKGVGGLVSGLDTDELVKGMTASTRNKLTKQLNAKELLGWKAQSYRGVSNKLIDLSQKYLSFTSTTNLFSESFFMSNTITSQGSNSKAVNATGSSDILSKLKINSVSQLASAANFVTTGNASLGQIETGEINFSDEGANFNNLAGETVTLSYGGQNYKVTIDDNFSVAAADGIPTKEELATAFNEALAKVKTKIPADGSTEANPTFKTLGDVLEMEAGDFNVEDADDPSNPDKNYTVHTVTLKSKAADDTTAISIVSGTGKSMVALGFDDETYGITSSSDPTKPIRGTYNTTDQTTNVKFGDSMAGKNMTFNFNGVSKTIEMPKDKDSAVFKSADAFKTFMQEELGKKFGANKISVNLQDVDGTGKIGKLTFETTDPNSTLTFANASDGITGEKSALNTSKNLSNRLNVAKPLEDASLNTALTGDVDGVFKIKINGKEFSFDKNVAIKDMLSTINNSDAGVNIQYLSTTDKFSVTNTETGSQGQVNITDVDGNLAAALFGVKDSTDPAERGYSISEGVDSKMVVDFGQGAVDITRSSNSFALDGINFTLNSTFAAGSGDPVTFTSKQDTDKVAKAVESFIKDYNEILALVNKEVSTRPNKAYAPLTAEQAESMTETQVKDWEAKAKEGMLFGDPTVNALASDLRFALSFDVAGSSIALKDLGITVSSSYKENGKLSFDEKKFKEALEKSPEEVMKIFTAPSDPTSKNITSNGGLMTRMEAINKKYVATTGEPKGSLISLAGLDESLTARDSLLFKQNDLIEKEITRLTKSLKAEEDRYFRQFTSLEKYMSQMNAQSSWLTDQLG